MELSKHNHNYTQYSSKPKPQVNNQKPAVDAPKSVETKTPAKPVQPVVMSETVETKRLSETVEGVVVGCSKLNVRAEASLFSDVVCVLDAHSEIEIDVNKSDKDWVHVCTATGVEGYCMRKFVEAHL